MNISISSPYNPISIIFSHRLGLHVKRMAAMKTQPWVCFCLEEEVSLRWAELKDCVTDEAVAEVPEKRNPYKCTIMLWTMYRKERYWLCDRWDTWSDYEVQTALEQDLVLVFPNLLDQSPAMTCRVGQIRTLTHLYQRAPRLHFAQHAFSLGIEQAQGREQPGTASDLSIQSPKWFVPRRRES